MAEGFTRPLASLGLLLGLSSGCPGDGNDDSPADTEGINLTEGMTGSSGPVLDVGGGVDTTDGSGSCIEGLGGCSNLIDLLFIIDNSGSMGEEQLNLALNMPKLIHGLENLTDPKGNPVTPNVHIMVTTTDSGNPLCEPFYDPGRGPENGAPISDACTDRLARFESNTMPPVNAEDACNTVCPMPVAPDDTHIEFNGDTNNVPDVPPVDIDGDGMDDSAVAQALSCVGPQGIDGCGYESPLDAMLEALDSGADWNGSGGFLRDGSLLAVAVITDEADCSIASDAVMMNTDYMELHPETGMPVPTSAICWNAGVVCDGPDGNGVYAECHSEGDALRPVQEYIDFLKGQDRRVVMLGILGVPPVTERNEEPPYQPIAGGVLDLVYRDWVDGEYPTGDILPDDVAAGFDAAFKQYQFGVGPGCTGQTDTGEFTGQAIPPVRVKEVCESLNIVDDPDTPNENEAEIRCCIESICDTDFSGALQCLQGLIEDSFIPPQ